MKSGSNLERVIASGQPAVTAELGPPMSADPHEVQKKAQILKGHCDAANITDCQTAVVRISSIAAAVIALREGLEPVMQMTCRDRNRIAMQADLLGAAALGLKNCLCIAGDHQKFSAAGKLKGHPGAKNVYDVDSIQLISIVKDMRDAGVLESGDPISQPTPFFIGAVWTPLAPPEEFRVLRLAKKIEAGADFIQTQAIFDMKRFATAVAVAREKGLTDRAAILAGIIVPKSAKMLEYMHANVPGVEVPPGLIKRMAAAKDQRQEGYQITVELIQAAQKIPGVKGVHLQAIESEDVLPEIIRSAGLLPRPQV